MSSGTSDVSLWIAGWEGALPPLACAGRKKHHAKLGHYSKKLVLAGLLLTILHQGIRANELQALTVSHAAPSELHLDGIVGPGDYWRVAAALNGQERTVVISGAGGDVMEAIRVSRLVRERGLSVVVRGFCASACAQYLLPAGRERTVEQGSLVVFHHYLFTLVGLATHLGVPTSRAQREAAVAETAYLRELGIDADLGARSQLELGTFCVFSRRAGGEDIAVYHAGHAGWVPRREYLAGVGLKLGGYWPTSIEEVVATMVARLPADKRFPVKLSTNPERIPEEVTRQALAAIPACPNSQ